MNKRPPHIVLVVLLFLGSCVAVRAEVSQGAEGRRSAEPSKASYFFCNAGKRLDRFFLTGLDTAYIVLPEFRWRAAFVSGGTGLYSTYTTWVDPMTPVNLHSNSMPSVELGFNAGFRSLAFGYSWDVLQAYSANWNISLGSKGIGVEFQRNVSSNLSGYFTIYQPPVRSTSLPDLHKGELRIANTNLNVWFALNRKHYSHNAAIKQSYIQKRTAGSVLLSLAYMATEIGVMDSLKYFKDESSGTLIDGVTGMITRQVAVGVGYGINYTPNHGKVLLHAAANMQVVCYSVNHISYITSALTNMPGEPQYVLRPDFPVHVSGNMRAAVSWEINKRVHLSAWAQANNLRFSSSKRAELSVLDINNWYWQAHLTVGVRFGVSEQRTREVLGEPVLPKELPSDSGTNSTNTQNKREELQTRLPKWVTDYFFSPTL